MYYSIFQHEISDFIIAGDDSGIHFFKFYSEEFYIQIKSEGYEQNGTYFKNAISQLDEYFSGKREHFDLKLNPQGTMF